MAFVDARKLFCLGQPGLLVLFRWDVHTHIAGRFKHAILLKGL
jgi:hypothetical protein